MVSQMRFKRLFFFTLIFLLLNSIFSQDVSQERLVRILLWAQKDVYPGYFDEEISEKERANNVARAGDNEFSVPVRKIKEISPFMLEGMVYGWNFSYTPYDKARGVEEFFEFEPVQKFSSEQIGRISYENPWTDEANLFAWVEFRRDESQLSLYKSWTSIVNPRIRGTGYAKLSEGFDGIQKATGEALKEAVRNYERTKIKTKPKEISGTVLMTKEPQIGINSGRYKVTLEFFMEIDRIVEYRVF